MLLPLLLALPPFCASSGAPIHRLPEVFEHRWSFEVRLVERELSQIRDGEEEWLERPLPEWTLAREEHIVWLDDGSERSYRVIEAGETRTSEEREVRERATSPLVGRRVRFDEEGAVAVDEVESELPAGLVPGADLDVLLPANPAHAEEWSLPSASLRGLLFPGETLAFRAEASTSRALRRLDARREQARNRLEGSLAARVVERTDQTLRVALEGQLVFEVGDREEITSGPGVSGDLSQNENHALDLTGELRIDPTTHRVQSVELSGSLLLDREDVRTLGGERGEYESVRLHRFEGTFDLRSERRPERGQ